MAVPTYTKTGQKSPTAAKLDKSVFSVDVKNHELIKQAYLAYLANGRLNLAVTKTRGEVRGGGRKPWRQKGTGRARVGSRRTPVWRGGGIVFGPTGQENYSIQLSLKAKRQAVRQALSLSAASDKIKVIEDIKADGKTSALVKLMSKLGADRRTLLVVADKTPELIRSSRNLSGLSLVRPTYLNVYDLLNADAIIFSSDALKLTTEWLSGGKRE